METRGKKKFNWYGAQNLVSPDKFAEKNSKLRPPAESEFKCAQVDLELALPIVV